MTRTQSSSANKSRRSPAPQSAGAKAQVIRSSNAPRTGAGASGATKGRFSLAEAELIRLHDTMVRARVLEERLIRMYKKNDGYFWLGGPGEEAFDIPLGLAVHKGQGLDYDFLHLHYRSTGILLAMGMNPMDMMRQMKNTVTDPFSGGRNFVAHASIRKWNVVPITSTIETQYATAIGTGIAHRRHGGKGITIVTGGDAGTAEGEFASCLIWSSRPGEELPLLIIVQNNKWGISTPYGQVQAAQQLSDRGKAFGMKTRTINGNDVETSVSALREAMAYVRTERKPYLLEAKVSRLYGHSSATGANFISHEEDPIVTFEAQLEQAGVLKRKQMDEVRARYEAEMLEQSKQVIQEPMPDPSTIYDHTYYGQKGRYW